MCSRQKRNSAKSPTVTKSNQQSASELVGRRSGVDAAQTVGSWRSPLALRDPRGVQSTLASRRDDDRTHIIESANKYSGPLYLSGYLLFLSMGKVNINRQPCLCVPEASRESRESMSQSVANANAKHCITLCWLHRIASQVGIAL